MSVSDFHGGLSWEEPLPSSSSASESQSKLSSRNINEYFNPRTSCDLDLEERMRLCKEVGEEILEEETLRSLLQRKEQFRCYDGFEPSGRMHIAQGVMKALNVNKITRAGGIFIFWVADWFALLNNKMDGDLEKIRVVGRYFVEVWKAAGMDLQNVQFLWASEEINKRPDEYWSIVIDISRKFNITRIKKCGQIMGRNQDGDEQPTSQMLYPCMQCADIFFLKADVCQLGKDQRKVNALALEYCGKLHKTEKPVIVSHHMLMGLKQGQEKMSKSDPNSAIFMEDSREAVKKKIRMGYCAEKEIEKNPILDYCRYIIFPACGSLTITRKEGGDQRYATYEELEKDYASGNLHPSDLKPSVADAINTLLQPVRDHFTNDPYARDLLAQIKEWQAEIDKKKAAQNAKAAPKN